MLFREVVGLGKDAILHAGKTHYKLLVHSYIYARDRFRRHKFLNWWYWAFKFPAGDGLWPWVSLWAEWTEYLYIKTNFRVSTFSSLSARPAKTRVTHSRPDSLTQMITPHDYFTFLYLVINLVKRRQTWTLSVWYCCYWLMSFSARQEYWGAVRSENLMEDLVQPFG